MAVPYVLITAWSRAAWTVLDVTNPLIDGLITTISTSGPGALRALFHRVAVDLSRSTRNYLAGLIRRRRRTLGTPWRLLDPGQQALLELVHLRKDGLHLLVLDGTLIACDRVRADRPYYSASTAAME